jgi:hypothetical protein
LTLIGRQPERTIPISSLIYILLPVQHFGFAVILFQTQIPQINLSFSLKMVISNGSVGPLIYEHCKFLKQIKTKSLKRRRRLLIEMKTEEMLALSEICLNILLNRFQLTPRQKRRMMPYVDFIRQMGRIRSEKGAREVILKKAVNSPKELFPSILTPILKHICK